MLDFNQLREVLAPFIAVANGIPSNWPDQCPLRVDSGPDRDGVPYEWLCYHGVDNEGKPIDGSTLLPTIGQWRALAKLLEAIA